MSACLDEDDDLSKVAQKAVTQLVKSDLTEIETWFIGGRFCLQKWLKERVASGFRECFD